MWAVLRKYVPNGDGKKQRPWGIPTVRERVAQMVAKLVLEPIFEAGTSCLAATASAPSEASSVSHAPWIGAGGRAAECRPGLPQPLQARGPGAELVARASARTAERGADEGASSEVSQNDELELAARGGSVPGHMTAEGSPKTFWRPLLREIARSIVAPAVIAALVTMWFAEPIKALLAFRNTFADHRLTAFTTLWTETNKHCLAVIQAVRKKGATVEDLKSVGAAYYAVLDTAGMFLGLDRMQNIRDRVGDGYLDSKVTRLLAPSTQAEELIAFRDHCRALLDELRKTARSSDE